MEPAIENLQIDDEDDIKLSPIHEAAKRGYTDQMQEILEQLSPEEQSSLIISQDRLFNTPLHWAASGGHFEAVEYILSFYTEGNGDVNATNNFGDTALHRAAWKGHPKICDILVQNGAGDSRYIQNSEGKTPLDLARKLEVKKFVTPPPDFGEEDEEFDQEDEDSD